MPSTTCAWCHRLANMTRASPVVEIEPPFGLGAVTLMAAFSCDHCQRLLLAYCDTDKQNYRHGGIDEFFAARGDALNWTPRIGVGKAFPDVPLRIAAAAAEVHECMSIGAIRAAVALARAVLESTAKDKGITTGNLQSKIDSLHTAGHVREHVKEAAHELRLDGNEIAHGDQVAPISVDEAREVVDLLDEILNEVYQSPAKVQRVRESRAKRQPPADGSGTGVV